MLFLPFFYSTQICHKTKLPVIKASTTTLIATFPFLWTALSLCCVIYGGSSQRVKGMQQKQSVIAILFIFKTKNCHLTYTLNSC